ncbi:MAG: hypothetical protein WBK91_11015 [Alphaproteobacteria bacterium]
MVQDTQASARFVGVYYAGTDHGLVALFESGADQARYYMTIGELCDRIEHQMGTGMYYNARTMLMLDRVALLALIEAQRKVLALKAAYDDFPALESGVIAFANMQVGWEATDSARTEIDKPS